MVSAEASNKSKLYQINSAFSCSEKISKDTENLLFQASDETHKEVLHS